MHLFMAGSKTKMMLDSKIISEVFIADVQQWNSFVEAALAIAQSDAGLKDIFSQLYAQISQKIQDNTAQLQANHQEKRDMVYFQFVFNFKFTEIFIDSKIRNQKTSWHDSCAYKCC